MWKPKQLSTGLDFPPISDAEKTALETHPATRGLYGYQYIGEDSPLMVNVGIVEQPKEVKPYTPKGQTKSKKTR
jgi:hypothetical protein